MDSENVKAWGIKNAKRMALFRLSFNEAGVRVHEQYLLFDSVAMVSAIGGTMGLCISLSFSGVASSLMGFIQQIVNFKLQGTKKKVWSGNPKNVK